jgi:hypothetical protein
MFEWRIYDEFSLLSDGKVKLFSLEKEDPIFEWQIGDIPDKIEWNHNKTLMATMNRKENSVKIWNLERNDTHLLEFSDIEENLTDF